MFFHFPFSDGFHVKHRLSRIIRLFSLLVVLGTLFACSSFAPKQSPQLGLHFSALSNSLLKQIASFRVMAFDASIYKCRDEKKVIFNKIDVVGFQVMATFDWSFADAIGNIGPVIHLDLPPSEETSWIVMVEAYNKKRSLQLMKGAQVIATGCSKEPVFVSKDHPSTVIVSLYP